MMANARHLRRELYRSMPWRNGSGITLEIARAPAAGTEFLWRLSVAIVGSSGPFSDYTGYRRSVTLIDGNGFCLDIGGSDPVLLDAVGATSLFPGDASTSCTLINGPSSDLSLVVREPGQIVAVEHIQSAATRITPLQSQALSALFCIGAQAMVAVADDPMAQMPQREHFALARHDTLLLGSQSEAVSTWPSAIGPVDLLVLTWRPAGS